MWIGLNKMGWDGMRWDWMAGFVLYVNICSKYDWTIPLYYCHFPKHDKNFKLCDWS